MLSIINLIRLTHIISGCSALLFGLIPICVAKGSRIHRTSGLLYFGSMAVLAITAFGLFVLEPFSDNRLFLACIGFFSFYLTASGIRAWATSNPGAAGSSGKVLQRISGLAVFAMGIAMLIIAAHHILTFFRSNSARDWNRMISGLLYALFGWFSVGIGRADVKSLRQPKQTADPYPTHVTRVLGAYTATVTAFFVVNLSTRLSSKLNIFLLILPGAIGGVLIPIFVARGRKKAAARIR